jgi:hypothetical protein
MTALCYSLRTARCRCSAARPVKAVQVATVVAVVPASTMQLRVVMLLTSVFLLAAAAAAAALCHAPLVCYCIRNSILRLHCTPLCTALVLSAVHCQASKIAAAVHAQVTDMHAPSTVHTLALIAIDSVDSSLYLRVVLPVCTHATSQGHRKV